CGGRGSGAVEDALSSSQGVTLVAMGDLFPDRLTEARSRLKEKFGAAIDVPDARAFTGFDAFRQVLETDANYVILATPPAFRPPRWRPANTSSPRSPSRWTDRASARSSTSTNRRRRRGSASRRARSAATRPATSRR